MEHQTGHFDVERFSEGDLIEALLAAQPVHEGVPGAMTTAELCKTLGLGPKCVRQRLRELEETGRLGHTEKRVSRLDKRLTTVHAYYLLPE